LFHDGKGTNLIENSQTILQESICFVTHLGVLIIEPRLFRDARGYFFAKVTVTGHAFALIV